VQVIKGYKGRIYERRAAGKEVKGRNVPDQLSIECKRARKL
jgi:hypothetical protein